MEAVIDVGIDEILGNENGNTVVNNNLLRSSVSSVISAGFEGLKSAVDSEIGRQNVGVLQAKKNSIYLMKRLAGKTNKEIGEMFEIVAYSSKQGI